MISFCSLLDLGLPKKVVELCWRTDYLPANFKSFHNILRVQCIPNVLTVSKEKQRPPHMRLYNIPKTYSPSYISDYRKSLPFRLVHKDKNLRVS